MIFLASTTTLIIMLTILFISIILLFFIVHPHKLSKTDKEKIKKFGIVHYTSKESFAKCDKKNPSKKLDTYFFINEDIAMNILEHNKLQDKHYKIIISNLTDNQMKKLKKRSDDFSLSYKGDFILDLNNITVEKAQHQNNNLYSEHFKRYKICERIITAVIAIVFILMTLSRLGF